MNRPDQERAELLFERALELPRGQRGPFLRAECGDDPRLAAEIASLLDAHDASDGFLDGPAATPPGPALEGVQLGRYRVLKQIARGGMGAVYEAEQDEPRRRVALKVLGLAFDGTAREDRFRREIEIVGRLRHPGIAQVFEGGVAEIGVDRVPYMALELVPSALSVVAWADQQQLDTRARIELVLEVCDALQYAHLRGIVHRDLKPANLLVDDAGRAKVIDFGIAQIVEGDGAASPGLTQRGQILGTLEYMSPEQCDGAVEELDLRTDVYSLGLVLYELLCGVQAFQLGRLTWTQALQRRRQAPAPPRRVAPDLPGDLEAIVLHAIDSDREHRYGSIAELADDLRRALRHEPIRARPPGRLRAAALFARRHAVLVTATSIVVLTLLAATLVSLSLAQRARREAETRLQTLNFLLEIFQSDTPEFAQGEERGLRHMLARLPDRIEARLAGDPRVHAMLLYHFGKLSQLVAQRELAQRMLERALEIGRANGLEVEYLGRISHLLALVHPPGDAEGAVELYEGALELLDPDVPELRAQRRTVQLDFAQLLLKTRRIDEAALLLDGAADALAADPAAEPHALAVCAAGLGRVALARRDVDGAIAHFDRAVAILDPLPPSTNLASSLVTRGLCHKVLGDLDAALVDYQRALELQQLLLPEPGELGRIEQNLARLFLAMKRFDDAFERQERAIALFVQAHGPDGYATIDLQFGIVADRIAMGRVAEAEQLARAILPVQRRLMGAEHPSVATTLDRLAHCADERSAVEEARELRAAAAAIRAAPKQGDGR